MIECIIGIMEIALVTGGAGFIGSNIADRLINDGVDIVTIDDLSNGKMENVNKKAKFYKFDIRRKNLIDILNNEINNLKNLETSTLLRRQK